MSVEKITKSDIKDAVNESLLEALAAAEEKQKQDNKSLKAYLQGFIQVLQICLLPVLAYLLLQVVQLQKDVVKIQEQISHHQEDTDDKAMVSALIHHTGNISPCDGCHGSSKSGHDNQQKINDHVKHELEELKNRYLKRDNKEDK